MAGIDPADQKFLPSLASTPYAMTGLSIITPTQNPNPLFLAQINDLLDKHPNWQIIIIDDASDVEVAKLINKHINVEIHRNETPLGAGASRNIGLGMIKHEYTVFLDDDDIMDWEVVCSTIESMNEDPSLDVSLSLYDMLFDGRQQSASEHDQAIITEALKGRQASALSLTGNERLLAFTNYPWNKVYRSSFLRKAHIRFSETHVQNDVFAHWATLLRAGRIYVSHAITCTKVEYSSADRIGNTSDARCRMAFRALRQTYALVHREGGIEAQRIFLPFYLNLVKWLMSKAEKDQVRSLIFEEHQRFINLMESQGRLEPGNAEIPAWSLWEAPIMVENSDGERHAQPHDSEITRNSVVLAEITRLKRLANAFREENETLKAEILSLHSACEAIRIENEALRSSRDMLQRVIQRRSVRLAVQTTDFLASLIRRR